MVAYRFGPFEIGPHTMWLGAHGVFMLGVLVCVAFLAGAVWFARPEDRKLVPALRVASLLNLLAMLALMITGLVPDIGFEKGQAFSGVLRTDFGVFRSAVTDANVGAFTGPLLFDLMEHVSFVVPGLAALLCFLVWHYGRRVAENGAVRGAMLSVLILMAGWVLVIGNLGLYVTKVLTFPYTR